VGGNKPFGNALPKVNIAKDKDPIKNIFFFPYTSASLPQRRKRQPYEFIDSEQNP
jgi:hypothetical protein